LLALTNIGHSKEIEKNLGSVTPLAASTGWPLMCQHQQSQALERAPHLSLSALACVESLETFLSPPAVDERPLSTETAAQI
jgi:hypothetical protein